jgi:FkbM family methyltransferase
MKYMDQMRAEYLSGGLDKSQYIRRMYEGYHCKLFEYAVILEKTNIRKIEVEDGRVIMTSRDRGVRIECPPGDYRVTPIEILNFLDYEKHDSAMIERLFEDGDVFLDVGANMGWYSINISLARRDAQIHCFEPIGKTYEYLVRNIALNSLGNVIPHAVALSDYSGVSDFYYYEEGSGNASAVNVSERQDAQVVRCAVRTLDDFVTENKLRVSFIKCDVEGAELLVYKGGLKTLNEQRPIVFSEILRKWSAKYGYHPNDIFALFEGLGYSAFTAVGGHLRKFSRMNELTQETNFFFLHADAHQAKITQWCLNR